MLNTPCLGQGQLGRVGGCVGARPREEWIKGRSVSPPLGPFAPRLQCALSFVAVSAFSKTVAVEFFSSCYRPQCVKCTRLK